MTQSPGEALQKPILGQEAGKMNVCAKCGTSENLQKHHVSYEPEEIQILCQKCHGIIHNISPNLAEAKIQYENLKDLEKVRIGIENRVRSLKGWNIDTELLKIELDTVKKLERDTKKRLIVLARDKGIFGWLIKIKGIAGVTASELIALLGDIDRFDTISSLWCYIGLHVENGIAPKLRKGKQIRYSPKLKSLCLGIIGKNFVRKKSNYRKFYDEKKIYYEQNREWTKGRRHNAAIRYMVKQFIKDLWLKWRALENLPITTPHPQDQPTEDVKTNHPVCQSVEAGDSAGELNHHLLEAREKDVNSLASSILPHRQDKSKVRLKPTSGINLSCGGAQNEGE